MTPPLLSLENITKSYGGAPALRGVDLAIAAGEIHALMGENGAGKSTLIKILAGVVAPDTATIRIDGAPVAIDSPRAAQRLGLRFIHQELDVVPTLSVAENLVIGRPYPRRLGVLVDWRKLNRVAAESLGRLGITHLDPRQKMARLAVGDQMLVKLSSAFLSDAGEPARLYVMDEPTAALTREESERLFTVLREIRAAGHSVLYVSHRLDEVMTLCDRATVLRDGRSIDSGRMAEITHDDLVAMMIGRRVEDAYPAPTGAPSEQIAYEGHGLRVRKGEILGIAGLSGMGQTALLRRIFGKPGAAWAKGVAYVPRERRSEGLVQSRPIFENITLPHLGAQSLGGTWLTPRRERALATRIGEDVRLRAAGPNQLALELSGGNQQKVVFAKALSGNPKLLLLDEPTRGVDVGAKFDIYSIIREMTAKGMAVILVSSDLPELLGMADRIAVMRGGVATDTVDAIGLSEETLLNLCYGRGIARSMILTLLRRYGTLIGFILIVAFFWSRLPDTFMTPRNWLNISQQLSMLTVVAAGMTIVMVMGDFDLSVGSMASLAGIVAAVLFTLGWPIWAAVGAALLVGLAGGLFNGALVSLVGILPFVATLATLTMFSGAAFIVSGGKTISGRAIPEAFGNFARDGVAAGPLAIPNLTIVAAVVVALVWVLLEQTTFGRRLYAIGGNIEAAHLSGVAVRRLKLAAFALTGLSAAGGGLLYASRVASANPTQGSGLMLNAIAAVFLGMTMSEQGEARILATVVGVLILGVLDNGLTQMNVDSYVRQVLVGAIIVVAVAASSLLRSGRR